MSANVDLRSGPDAHLGEHLTQPNPWRAATAVAFDWALYLGATAGALWFDNVILKLGCGILAGTAISTLFILGHDAGHNSLFPSRRLNRMFGRVCFLPCLHNATLWIIQHNRLHHQETNVRGLNSFSPFDFETFRALPAWRRHLERIYRNPLGFGLYYLLERWWGHKFFPGREVPNSFRKRALLDFLLLLAWLVISSGLVAWIAFEMNRGIAAQLFFGLVFPFYVWNHLMGFTAFVQHTHPRALWAPQATSRRSTAWQIDVTVLVRFPRWYDTLSHNIMHHPAHHLNARVPWYRLPLLEREMPNEIASRILVETISLGYLLNLSRCCKLFDYRRGMWMDFRGRPSVDVQMPRSLPAATLQ